MEAMEFRTKGRNNTVPMTQYARSQNQIDLPNHVVRKLHPLLKLPLHGHSSVLRIKVPKTRPAMQQMQWDKGWQNSTSSAEMSPMEYDCDLKTYYYQNEAQVTIAHNSIGIFSMTINGKSINKNVATLDSCLMHCRGKGEYIWSVFSFSDFFFFFPRKL